MLIEFRIFFHLLLQKTNMTDANLHSNINFTKNTRKRKPSPQRRGAPTVDKKLTSSKSSEATIPTFKIKKGEVPVRVGSLLGLEQVGQCLFIEYENDMIIVDAGMEFAAGETLGADYIVPDIRYIKQNKKKLRGIILSHGHLDHIG